MCQFASKWLHQLSVLIRELLVVILGAFTLAPILGASCADKHQIELGLGWLGECDCLIVTTEGAFDILAARKCGVLDALWIYDQLLCPHGKVSHVDAVVDFASFDSLLVLVANVALKAEVTVVTILVLHGFKHVVAF